MKLKLVISLTGILMLCGFTMKPSTDTTTGKEDNRNWVLGPFVRPEGANPTSTYFFLLSDAEATGEVGRE